MPEPKFAKITIETEGEETITMENVSHCALVAISMEAGIKPLDRSHFMGDAFVLIGRLETLQERLRFVLSQGAVAEVFKQMQQQMLVSKQVQNLNLQGGGKIVR